MRFLNYKARMNKWINCREKLCFHAAVTLRSPLSGAYCLSEKERKGDNSLQTRWQGFKREPLNNEDPEGSKHSQRSCLGSTQRVGHDHACSRIYSGGIHVLSRHKSSLVQVAEGHSDQNLWVTRTERQWGHHLPLQSQPIPQIPPVHPI